MTGIFQKERINKINNKLLLMADFVEKQILKAMDTLRKYDNNLVEEIIKDDDKVDNLQQIIEEDCIKLIATSQSVARDLRNIFTASKISTELERMADHAVDICKIARKIKGSYETFPKEASVLWEMAMK
ncbi:PhoU domain-containing protein [Clostridium sp. DSM 8431]|uniref:phosphate signaling complex PhoU family protein n=1 Tax=Clostridium sp. DSM 8431 TaxID=1761781 RepID=UPI0008F033FB|nr:PhoU domain-containing protein [Clostridium sp. DSM 8431]SFU54615.1 PhoU domain-containing protein [Clostridium sp. DSM 8431]